MSLFLILYMFIVPLVYTEKHGEVLNSEINADGVALPISKDISRIMKEYLKNAIRNEVEKSQIINDYLLNSKRPMGLIIEDLCLIIAALGVLLLCSELLYRRYEQSISERYGGHAPPKPGF